MISDIIRARDEKLLTDSEAKSYIQRFLESHIQQTEAYSEEIKARAAKLTEEVIDMQDEDEDDDECGCEDECQLPPNAIPVPPEVQREILKVFEALAKNN